MDIPADRAAKASRAFAAELLDHDGHHDSRYPISVYKVTPDGILRCLGDTTDEGVTLAIRTWRDDGEIDHNSAIGIRDREQHAWLVNPFARYDRRR